MQLFMTLYLLSYKIIVFFLLTMDIFITTKISAVQLERTKKVEKYIGFLMLEVREMREESGYIYLKV